MPPSEEFMSATKFVDMMVGRFPLMMKCNSCLLKYDDFGYRSNQTWRMTYNVGSL